MFVLRYTSFIGPTFYKFEDRSLVLKITECVYKKVPLTLLYTHHILTWSQTYQ